MWQRLTHISLVLVLLLSSEVWAIGLGEIRLDSALNEPLRAEISLLSATPDEIASLNIAMASAATFTRYGIDRPFFLQEVEFNVESGANGGVVQLRSRSPITEPFLTFLVEANWPGGRLLREYTVLLDPPTYAPPAATQAPAVTAPSRSAPTDSGRIERQQPAPQPQTAPPARQTRPSLPSASAPADDTPYDTSGGGDYVVQRSETLWGIASRMRPDSRLTMNQTMLAIFEANPGAFGGNINVLRAGAALRIPSADEIFRIGRNDAFAEARRQNEAWAGGTGYTAPPVETRPSLTLVPPDEEPTGLVYDDELVTAEPLTREQEIENRINELEIADVPDQPSLLEIRDNELATLRQELANIRGEVYEPPADVTADVTEDPFVEDMADETSVDDVFVEEDDVAADDSEVADEAADAADAEAPSTVIRTPARTEPSIVDRILGALTSYWAGIVAALVVVAGLLFWFMRRGRGDEDASGAPWEALDSDEMAPGSLTSTETMRAPTPDEAIMVVEQDSAIREPVDATAEMPRVGEAGQDSGSFGSLEDTFSSETAVNLDQTDPVAEADFHMAYGLYDQAADLINGALETDPTDRGLMSKLCEIYFVWGNRDAFIDAARNLKSSVGDGESPEWDKTVIMGQQIAADHALFAGAGVAAATKAVDLSFEAETGEAGALDMDFGGADSGGSDVIDLGADDGGAEDGVDFMFDAADDDGLDLDLDTTAESPTIATTGTEKTLAMPTPDDTVESPTIEQEFGELDGTSELPSLEESLGQAISDTGQGPETTAEINLDDLDLKIDGLAETELASLDDLDETGTNEALSEQDFADTGSITGRNPEVDPNSTGVREGLDLDVFDDLEATGEMRLATDETGRSPLLDPTEESLAETEVGIDQSLLDATGVTQVLSEDMSVNTGADIGGLLSDEEATMLAGLDDGEDEGEFDFAKTEALPADAFVPADVDTTGEMPAAGTTDVDLELDDLTAALKVSEVSDTMDQLANEPTVEQPRPADLGSTAEIPTMSLGPEDMSEDLHDARTMTEVGTKLDLARAYVDMGDPAGARSILEEVLDEGDQGQRQQAQQLLDSLPS
jgi:pilus assembly protein FimV